MSTPDFLDSMDKLPTRETVAELKPEPETEVEETEEEVEEEEAAPVEQEQKPEPVEKPATPTVANESKEAAGLKAGIAAERKKRQELEAKLRELEARVAPVREQQEQIDFYQNPEGYVAQVEQRLQATYLNALAADQREIHEDFDEVTQFAVDVMNKNPHMAVDIQTRVRNAGNPAREAYRIGRELMEAQKEAELLKDPAAYKASIRDEVIAQLRAELATQAQPKVALPRDLSNGRSGADQVANTPPVDPKRGTFGDFFDNRPRQT